MLRGNPSFSMHPWPAISDEAKHLVQWMLQPDPKKRPTAAQALSEWGLMIYERGGLGWCMVGLRC